LGIAKNTRFTSLHHLSRPRDMDATISAPLLGPPVPLITIPTARQTDPKLRGSGGILVIYPGGSRTQRQGRLERMNWLIQPLSTAMSIGLMLEPTHWLQRTRSSRELGH
jgi:hypothetical protein